MGKRRKAQNSPFSSLPEGCIANIISLTSRKDACRAAAVSLGFKSAAESDTVWERFLPADCGEIISGADSPVIFPSKKELYLYLCDSGLLVDGGKMSLRLIKSNGKKCYMLCARELKIAWGEAPGYWRWISYAESRFTEVLELQTVWRLDILGVLPSQLLSPNTNYAAYLVFRLSNNHCGLDVTLEASITLVGETIIEPDQNVRNVYIVPPRPRGRSVPERDVDVVTTRPDGWKEIVLGEFFIIEGDDFDVEIRLFDFEIEILNFKRGLVIEGIEVRPKGCWCCY